MPIYQDTDPEKRAKDLIRQVASYVLGVGPTPRNAKARIWRGAVSWGDWHTVSTRQGRDFYSLTLGVGTVVAVAGAGAFMAIGWWAVLPAVAVGFTGFFAKRRISRQWSKSNAMGVIAEIERSNSYLESDEALNNHVIAEEASSVFLREAMRLVHKVKGVGGRAGYFSAATTDEKNFYVDLAVHLSWEADIATKSIAGRRLRFRGSRTVGSADTATGIWKLSVMIKRSRLLAAYLDKYIDKLVKQLLELERQLAPLEGTIEEFVTAVVTAGPHHVHCRDDHCWGARERDLTVIDNDPTHNTSVPALGANTPPPSGGPVPEHYGAFEEHMNRFSDYHAQYGRDEGGADSYTPDATWSGAAIDTVAESSVAAITEGMEGFVQGAAQSAADFVVAPVGIVMSALVNEAVEWYTVNRPARMSVGRLRSTLIPGSATTLQDEIKSITKKPDADICERLLSRVHSHYLGRMNARHTKLERRLNSQPTPSPSGDPRIGLTCSDATELTRYYLKTFRYLDKCLAHLLVANKMLERMEGFVTKVCPGAMGEDRPPMPNAPATLTAEAVDALLDQLKGIRDAKGVIQWSEVNPLLRQTP